MFTLFFHILNKERTLTMKSRQHSTIGITALLLIQLFFNPNSRAGQPGQTDEGMPQLVRHGNVAQLYVDGKPFLIIGGELNNSTSSSLEYMKPIWQHVADLNFNTVLTPLSWELIEPKEGGFDFSLVDGLIKEARQDRMHLVFLWLASWKNGMSTYVPLWVKENYKKYPRATIQKDSTVEILSTFSEANVKADSKAFAALMKHIRETDGVNHTVLMIQVENEVGILGDSRDRSKVANAAFAAPVPKELMEYLVKHKEELVPEMKELWSKNSFQTSGNWEKIFGKGENCDEAFMAWTYARYVNTVVNAGKKEYPIPMYANAWLDQDCCPTPGRFPSGGPLAHVFDVWLAGAPAVDIMAPDLYVPEFEERCQKFSQRGNPLFIPEMPGGDDGARNVFLAVGSHNAIGVSPFGIDRLGTTASDAEQVKGPKETSLSKSYSILKQISPWILEKQAAGEIAGFVLDEKNPVRTYDLGGYRVEVSFDELFGQRAKSGYGIIMTDGPDKFLGAGSGFRVRFFSKKRSEEIIGIGSVDEGVFHDDVWVPGRRLNGDETSAGAAWRFSTSKLNIEKCAVYTYE
jgi:beta-galactosidase GanA